MIFQHRNFRDFLAEHMQQLPKQGYGEAKKMASHLRVSSTFMSQVLSGAKQLTPEQANLLADYLGLSGLESDYFFYLVQLDRAGTHQLKKYCEKKLKEIADTSLKLSERVQFKKVLTEEQKSVFYSHPLYSAIHLYTSIQQNGFSVDEVATRFGLPKSKASEILRFLAEAGLCDEKDGRYKIGTQSTHIGNDSPHLLRHHTNWRLRALLAGEKLTDEELMYTVNVSLAKEDFEKFREEMVQFIQKFLKGVYASPAEDIACFNLDFFWIR